MKRTIIINTSKNRGECKKVTPYKYSPTKRFGENNINYKTDNNEREIRLQLSKLKIITRRFISYFYIKETDGEEFRTTDLIEKYNVAIRDVIGSVNKVKSKRVLKVLGFEEANCHKLASYKGNESMYVIPINMYNLIDDGTELYAFTGDIVVKGKDEIDFDTRNGMMAYYIIINNTVR